MKRQCKQRCLYLLQVGVLSGQQEALPEASGNASAAAEDTAEAPAYIWHAMARQHGVHVQPLFELEHAGNFVVPATVYPSPKLQPGAAVLSTSLAASLGWPSPGTHLVVYPWPAAAQPPAQPSQVQPIMACIAS